MSTREDAISAVRAAGLALARGVELVSDGAQNCDDYAGRLHAGGFRKAVETLSSASAALRTGILIDLAAAQTAGANSLDALASANTDDLDVAATALAAGRTYLAELRGSTTAAIKTLDRTVTHIATLGPRTQSIATILRRTIEELDTALGHEQTATHATKEAINTLGTAQSDDEQPISDTAVDDPGWVNAEDSTPEARAAYNRIRNSPEDIPKIATNTGISQTIIEEAWQHFFLTHTM